MIECFSDVYNLFNCSIHNLCLIESIISSCITIDNSPQLGILLGRCVQYVICISLAYIFIYWTELGVTIRLDLSALKRSISISLFLIFSISVSFFPLSLLSLSLSLYLWSESTNRSFRKQYYHYQKLWHSLQLQYWILHLPWALKGGGVACK